MSGCAERGHLTGPSRITGRLSCPRLPAHTRTGGRTTGTPVHIVSKMLGHSRASITLDVYAHAVDGGGDAAGERLTALLAERAQG